MSTYTIGELDALITRATSESIPNGELDLPVAMEVSDIIRSRKLPPKDCMRCLKKRIMITSDNPNTQLASWKLTDICIKNGGVPFLTEICSKEFMDTIEQTIIKRNGDYKSVEIFELVSKILYELYIAFRNDSQLGYVSKVYEKLVKRGIKFPDFDVDSNNPVIMFDSKTPADWIESDACMICSKKFSLLNRRHHCRSCGGIYCNDHSSHKIPLPDLGIYEDVRVCDNCYDEYTEKRRAQDKTKKVKKKKTKRSHKSADISKYEDEDEDEQLRRAIELSLKEAQAAGITSNTDNNNLVPEKNKPLSRTQGTSTTVDDDANDPDLKAAIEASLREAEEEKRRRSGAVAAGITTAVYPAQPGTPQLVSEPLLTNAEEDDIYLFASLVERMRTKEPVAILEDNQLQRLYQKVISTKPKLNNILNDKIQKYNVLMDMNAKITDIMNIYDMLLEQQLRNINLSQQYTIPPQPSGAYAVQTASPMQQQEPLQEQTVQSPVSPLVGQQQLYQLPTQPQMQHQVTESQPQYLPLTAEQGPAIQNNGEPQQANKVADNLQHLEIKESNDIAHVPSEPPYPEDEYYVEVVKSKETSPRLKENSYQANNDIRNRPAAKLPYPVESDEKAQPVSTQQIGADKITNYDFPTIPTRRVPEVRADEEQRKDLQDEVPNTEASQPKEEELLLEL